MKKRLNRILRRAHRLWPDDENIWKTHINLLEKWNKRTQLSKLYEEYVGKYPHKVAVWMEAARFQLERNGSADQARKILYRAQQNIPNEPVIFDQLFRVELINACILRKRLEITGNLEENEVRFFRRIWMFSRKIRILNFCSGNRSNRWFGCNESCRYCGQEFS